MKFSHKWTAVWSLVVCAGAVIPVSGATRRVTGTAPVPGNASPAVVEPAPAPTFDRYEVILQRMPFGDEAAQAALEAAAAAARAVSVEAATPPFTQNLKICAITRDRFTGRIQVGIVDSVTKESYFLYEGESRDDMVLVAADYERERIVLKKGDETRELGLNDVQSGPAAVVKQGGVVSPVTRSRAATAAAPAEPPKPLYTGAALEKHLKEYQMDLIRAGGEKGPPLPMELTPEMDQQLVTEGVLPPSE